MREELLKKVEMIRDSNDTIGELHFFMSKDGYKLKKGNVHEDSQKEISDEFINYAVDFFSDTELSIMNLSAADDRKNVLYKYDFTEEIPEFSFIQQVQKDDGHELFKFKHDDIKNLKGYVVTYVHEDFALTIYKQHYPVFIIDKKKSLPLVFSTNDMIETINEDIFRLNSSFDFIMFDDIVYVKELNKLEKNYKFHEIIKKKAKESIEQIEQLGIIENIDEVVEDLEDVTFARKLIKVTHDSPVLLEVEKDTLLSFIKNFSDGMLLKKLKFNEDESGLILKTKESKNTFLKLLNDDFLISELTNHLYTSLAKDDVTPN